MCPTPGTRLLNSPPPQADSSPVTRTLETRFFFTGDTVTVGFSRPKPGTCHGSMETSGWGAVQLRVAGPSLLPQRGASVVIVGTIGQRQSRFLGTVESVNEGADGAVLTISIEGIAKVERREAPRFELSDRVRGFGLESGRTLDGVATDISARGLRWTVPTPPSRSPEHLLAPEPVALVIDFDPPLVVLATLVGSAFGQKQGITARARFDAITMLDRHRIEALGWTSPRRARSLRSAERPPVEPPLGSDRPQPSEARSERHPVRPGMEPERVPCRLPARLVHPVGPSFETAAAMLVELGPAEVVMLLGHDLPSRAWLTVDLAAEHRHLLIEPVGSSSSGTGSGSVSARIIGEVAWHARQSGATTTNLVAPSHPR